MAKLFDYVKIDFFNNQVSSKGWKIEVSTMRLCKKSDFDIITFHLTKCKWVNCILERYGKTKKFVKKIC